MCLKFKFGLMETFEILVKSPREDLYIAKSWDVGTELVSGGCSPR